MNNGEIYETEISDARWIAYDIPGNIGWIMYIICIVIFMKEEVNFFSVAVVIPAIIMLVGIIELISEKIAKLRLQGFSIRATGRRKNKMIAIKGLDRSDVSCC